MKKLVSLLIALCIISVSYMSISAADPTTVYYNKVTGNAGDNVKISVGIKNNVEITGLLLKIEYDSSAVQINSITNGSAFEDAMFTTPNMAAEISSPFVVSWISLDGLDTNGTILNISATLKKSMIDEFPINIVSCEANDIEENDVEVVLDNGAVPVIYFDEKECRPGDTVEVPIIVENNPGICALGIEIEYDNTLLTLNGIENGNLLPGSHFECGDISKQSVTLNWAGITESTKNGVLAKCSFTVNSQAELGAVSLGVKVIESIDVDEIEIPIYGKASFLNISTTTSTPAPEATQIPESTPEPLITQCFTIDNKGITADITNTGDEQLVTVIIAQYENNVLMDVKISEVKFAKDETRSFRLGEGMYKVFVWNSLNGMVPMTK